MEQKLKSPEQLPEIRGRKLVFTWDQEGAESIVQNGEAVVWREKTGFAVYGRFAEIAAILQRRYGARIKDLVPTPASEGALYGESELAPSYVQKARAQLATGKPRKFTYFELEKAVRERDASTLRLFHAGGGSPGARHPYDGTTPLHLAARWRYPEIVRVLVDGGANVNALDRSGASPLREALYEPPTPSEPGPAAADERKAKTLQIVQLLVEAGASTDGLNRPLRNLKGLARELYDPPLELAARHGDVEVVRYLLERGANPDVTDADGSTPLHTAVLYGRLEIVRLLIAAGADVNRPDPPADGLTPLLRAVSPIEGKENGEAMIRALVAAGADVNRSDAQGKTPLLAAIFNGKLDLIALLLSLGADVHRKDNDGDGALLHAVELGRANLVPQERIAPILEALRAAGADPAARNKEGKSARDLAEELGLTALRTLL